MEAEATVEAPARPLCGGRRKSGKQCRRPSGWGTDHAGYGRCKLHGGCTPTHRQGAALEAARVEAAKLVMGAPIRMEPDEALQFCIDVTRGEIAYCDLRISELTDADAAVPITTHRQHQELDRDGDVHELVDDTAQSTEDLHIWINTRQGATERLARFSKMAMDAGIDERQARLGERQAEILAAVVLAVVGQLGLSDTQRARVPALLAEHIGRFDEPAIEGRAA